MPFIKGQQKIGGKKKGSKSNGSGRSPDWLKAKCQNLIEKNNLIQFLVDVSAGKDVEQKVNDNGEVIKIPADVRDRLRALEMLMDRGYGKALQQQDLKIDMSHTISVDKSILESLEKSISEYKK